MTNTTNTITTDQILMGSFVKFQRMGEMILAAFRGSKATSINLFIDLYGSTKTFFSDSCRTNVKDDYIGMSATILNMCAHYRHFFRSIGVHTKIYLINGYNVNELYRRLVPDYNISFYKKFQNKLVYKMTQDNNALLEIIVPYLNDIYYIFTEFEPTLCMDYIMRNHTDNNPNIVISKDMYPCQLTYLHANTAFIMPKKRFGEDLSGIIPPNDHELYFESFWTMYANRPSMQTDESNYTIHPCNFSLLSGMTRFPERNLKTIVNSRTANKVIYSVVGNQPVKLSFQLLMANTNCSNVPVQVIENREHALDVEFMRGLYDDSVESKTMHLDNLYDPKEVNMILNDYFRNNPVDTQYL